jgi:hypothetical protein
MSKLSLVDIAPVATRLSRLIPLLASDQAGEVVATARAIGRVLAGKGLDWSALSLAMNEIQRLSFEPSPSEKLLTPFQMAVWCRDHVGGRLDAKDREFIASLILQLSRRRSLSEKQRQWLKDIYAKLHDGRRA